MNAEYDFHKEIEKMCREEYQSLSKTYGNGNRTWDDLQENEKRLVLDITGRVVRRLQRILEEGLFS